MNIFGEAFYTVKHQIGFLLFKGQNGYYKSFTLSKNPIYLLLFKFVRNAEQECSIPFPPLFLCYCLPIEHEQTTHQPILNLSTLQTISTKNLIKLTICSLWQNLKKTLASQSQDNRSAEVLQIYNIERLF